MNKEFIIAVLRRFGKAFLAGAVAQAVVILTTQPVDISSPTAIKQLASALVVGFLTGGCLAVEKLLRYDKTKP